MEQLTRDLLYEPSPGVAHDAVHGSREAHREDGLERQAQKDEGESSKAAIDVGGDGLGKKVNYGGDHHLLTFTRCLRACSN